MPSAVHKFAPLGGGNQGCKVTTDMLECGTRADIEKRRWSVPKGGQVSSQIHSQHLYVKRGTCHSNCSPEHVNSQRNLPPKITPHSRKACLILLDLGLADKDAL